MPSVTSFHPCKHLTLDDVSVPHLQAMVKTIVIYIKVSKTDQFGKGYHIHLARTGASLCPVSALLDYLSIRGTSKGPLFLLSIKQPLTRSVLVSKVRSALSTSGVDVEKYSGHSFRIGAATTTLRAGNSDAKIKMLGHWESSAYQLYLQAPSEELASVCPILATCQS